MVRWGLCFASIWLGDTLPGPGDYACLACFGKAGSCPRGSRDGALVNARRQKCQPYRSPVGYSARVARRFQRRAVDESTRSSADLHAMSATASALTGRRR